VFSLITGEQHTAIGTNEAAWPVPFDRLARSGRKSRRPALASRCSVLARKRISLLAKYSVILSTCPKLRSDGAELRDYRLLRGWLARTTIRQGGTDLWTVASFLALQQY
jgi:hypothetical protein